MEQLTQQRLGGIGLRVYGKDTISQDTEAQIREAYNHGHKIMKHLKILVSVPFAIRKVVIDVYYKKQCKRVASRVAE